MLGGARSSDCCRTREPRRRVGAAGWCCSAANRDRKSRLADEYATRVAADGALVVWGCCWELGGAPAYWPWTEALRGVIAQRSAAGADELGQLLPELQRPAVESAPEHAESARFRLFEAVVQFLRMASTEQPVVVVLEDLHAADEPSLVLLQYVAVLPRGCVFSLS